MEIADTDPNFMLIFYLSALINFDSIFFYLT